MSVGNEFVRNAMDSLVGVYIFDYTAAPSVSEHTNTSFARADARLTELLNKPNRDPNETNETITIMVLLAMQDVSCANSLQLDDSGLNGFSGSLRGTA